jgi:hypothetical protein
MDPIKFEDLIVPAETDDDMLSNLAIRGFTVEHYVNDGTVKVVRNIWRRMSVADQGRVVDLFQRSQAQVNVVTVTIVPVDDLPTPVLFPEGDE